MQLRYENGRQSEWLVEVEFPEEVHYIKYYFILTDYMGKTLYYSDRGFAAEPPE